MNSFPRRLIYFSIGFLLPALMLVCLTIITCAGNHPGLPIDQIWVGGLFGGAICVISSQVSLFNDTGD